MKTTIFTFIGLISFLFAAAQDSNASDSSDVYKFYHVQQRATYKGGDAALDKYISKHIKVPERMWELKQGFDKTVMVDFIIEKNGCVSNIKVRNKSAIPYDLQLACIQVFEEMSCKKWKPAKQRGKLVRMAFIKPIHVQIPPKE